MKKTKKCKNCKWYSVVYCNSGYLCKATETHPDIMHLCRNINCDGNCELYKAKWHLRIYNFITLKFLFNRKDK